MTKKNFKDVLDKLDIDEKFTTKPKQSKHKNQFINSIVAEKDWNYQSDLLHLPITKNGFKYLLVVTDVATRNFDFEPMKTTKSEETVKAMITEEQLKLLQEQQGKLNEMLRTVGVLEVQKSNVSKEIEALSKEIDSTKKELEEEYGQININLQDGSYTDIEKEDAE